MFTQKPNELPQLDCGNLKNVSKILLANADKHEFNEISKDNIVEKLFLEHFQSIVPHYVQKVTQYRPSTVCSQPSSGITPSNDDLWIFGYGSLVWKADFPYIDKKPGYIEGYQRRFFQHSIDHRGTREKPGRVVTLVPSRDASARVYGATFRIASAQKDEVLAHLDYREKNGYERCSLQFTEFGGAGKTFDVIMYIATRDNESFAGGDENELQPIAEQIYTSAGPSGPNREYLYKLADAMRELFPGVYDGHLFELEKLVKEREQRDCRLVEAVKGKIRSILEKEDVGQVVKEFHELVEKSTCEAFLKEVLGKVNGGQ